jgi:hypothetical protein
MTWFGKDYVITGTYKDGTQSISPNKLCGATDHNYVNPIYFYIHPGDACGQLIGYGCTKCGNPMIFKLHLNETPQKEPS